LSAVLEVRRILVATDFSEHAENALKTAVGLARTLDARLDLAHVIHEPVPVVLNPDEVF